MDNINSSVSEEKETQTAKKIVSDDQARIKLDKDSFSDSGRGNLLKKILKNKRLAIVSIIMLIFLVLIIILFISNSLEKKQSYSQKLNEVAGYIPAEGEGFRDTSVASNSINNLKKSDLSNTKNKDDLATYYNTLYVLFTETSDCSEAVETYNKEVRPKNVLLNDLQILWLIDCAQVTSAEGENMLKDGILYLELAIKDADPDDRDALTSRLETIKKRAKLWQNQL